LRRGVKHGRGGRRPAARAARRAALGLIRQDPDRIAAAVLRLAAAHDPVDRAELRADFERLVAGYAGRSIGDLPVGELIRDVLSIVRRHRLQLPRELALLVKAVVMLEGLGARLDPEFRFGEVLAPYAQRFVTGMLSPAVVARRMRQAGVDVAQLAVELPEQVRRLLELFESDGLRVRLPADDLETLATRVRRRDDRLVAAVLAAALIRGVVDLAIADPGRRRSWGRPMLALGAGAAGALGAYLARTARAS
jgi:ubiquinone biosynthesis protein